MAKSKRIALAVPPSVYDVLEREAKIRGVAISAVAAWLCGDWVANITHKNQIAEKQLEAINNTLKALFDDEMEKMDLLNKQNDLF